MGKSFNFDTKLLDLEAQAKEAGVSDEEILTAYELRKMAIEEEMDNEAQN